MTQRITEGGGIGRSLLSVLLGLILAAILIQLAGYDARTAFSSLFYGATGLAAGAAEKSTDLVFGAGPLMGRFDRTFLTQSLAKATPLLFTGLAIAVALRAGLFNIGAQGQVIVGALAAAVAGRWGLESATGGDGTLSPFLHIPLTLLVGALAGACWGAFSGLLKAYRGVHEVISTIMLNFVAANLAGYLVTHGWKDPKPGSMAAQTGAMAKSAWLPALVPNTSLTISLLFALLAAVLVGFMIRRTALGYEIRAVGLGAEAAQAAGIPVGRTLIKAMALSGALAGLAGAVEVMGAHHRYFPGVEGEYGFDGIAVALLGNLNGLGVTFSACFFGMLANGARLMEVQSDVPKAIAVVVQAIVILLIGVRAFRAPKAPTALAALTDAEEESDERF